MRYTGGLLGGSALTALMGDLGNGKFDGAWLVTNFENLNPANTYWSKQYNLSPKSTPRLPALTTSGHTVRRSSTRFTRSIGHLGIFVSGSVAKKEHDEFASNIDLIDALPPGLYEAVMIPKRSDDRAADLIGGDYLVRFEARTLDDISRARRQ